MDRYRRLPDPYWLASIFSFVPLLPVQAAVNRLHETVAPTAPRNDRYSGGNTLTIIFGALLLCLIVLGMLLPPENAAGVAPGVAS